MTSFDPHNGPVIVRVEVFGSAGSAILRLALDTGATTTVINTGLLITLGYDPIASPERIQITTGSGVEFAPRLSLSRIATLDIERSNFPVLSHTLPPSAGVDGLLGLDYFRGRTLTVDFRAGQITVT